MPRMLGKKRLKTCGPNCSQKGKCVHIRAATQKKHRRMMLAKEKAAWRKKGESSG